jgi:chemotaxis protein CheD
MPKRDLWVRPESSPVARRQMHVITIRLGEYRLSTDLEAVLATHSLGSCIAVTVYDPVVQMGGLLHSQLSESC